MDTTGQIVMQEMGNGTVIIAEDRGAYYDNNPARNVRKIWDHEKLALGYHDQVVSEILDRKSSYGEDRSGVRVHPITEADLAALRQAASAKKEARKAANAPIKQWVSPRGKNLNEEMDSADSIY